MVDFLRTCLWMRRSSHPKVSSDEAIFIIQRLSHKFSTKKYRQQQHIMTIYRADVNNNILEVGNYPDHLGRCLLPTCHYVMRKNSIVPYTISVRNTKSGQNWYMTLIKLSELTEFCTFNNQLLLLLRWSSSCIPLLEEREWRYKRHNASELKKGSRLLSTTNRFVWLRMLDR